MKRITIAYKRFIDFEVTVIEVYFLNLPKKIQVTLNYINLKKPIWITTERQMNFQTSNLLLKKIQFLV